MSQVKNSSILEIFQFSFPDEWLLLWLLWSMLWLVDLAEWTYYDWLLQLSNHRYPITANHPITLSNYNYTEWLVKNKADNALITFEEIATVMISCETSPNLMLIVYTPGPGRDVMKFNS